MTQMFNPPHPGVVLREWLGEMKVTDAAQRLGVSQVTLSRILNGASGISADMAIRLEQAFGTSAEMWLGLQMQYELWVARQKVLPPILPITSAA